MQPKLSAILQAKTGEFEIVDIGGKFILKPQHHIFKETPENEDLSMRIASTAGIEVPLHGLLHCIDDSMTYFIKRFDRVGHKDKVDVEDFSQLLNLDRSVKYKSSMEKVASVIDTYCTFPFIEKTKLFTRTVVNFLIGNEDMHLKNFSMITRDNKIELTPAYDFINSWIVLDKPSEEIALPLDGKKNNLRRKDFVEYYAIQRLKLPASIVNEQLGRIEKNLKRWEELISISFLSDDMKEQYFNLLQKRSKTLFGGCD